MILLFNLGNIIVLYKINIVINNILWRYIAADWQCSEKTIIID